MMTSRTESIPEAGIVGALQIRGDGTVWRAVSVDYDELGRLGVTGASIEAAEVLPEEPEGEEYQLTSWSSTNCSGNDVRVFNGESRTRRSTLSTSHDLHRSVVLIQTSGGQCSGVVVGPRDVLTAAHCVMPKTSGTPPPNPPVYTVEAICSRGNSYPGADCVWNPLAGFTLNVNPYWTGGSNSPSTDYALIEWTESGGGDQRILSGETEIEVLSTRSDSQIAAIRAGVYGHPGETLHGPGGSCAAETRTAEDGSAPLQYGMWLNNDAWRTDHVLTGTQLRTYFDTSDGQSGSPVFQCPSDPVFCATPSDAEEVIGLSTGWYKGWCPFGCPRTRGPKSSHFYTYITGVL